MGATYTAYNLRIIAVLTLGSLTFGYAYSVISNTLGQPSFSAYFGLAGDDAYANAISGAVNGLFAAGGVFGAIHTGWMCESKGRKLTMNTAAAISIIGGAVQTGSVHIAMFLVGRFVNGWGIGMMVTLIPIYQAEISPPNARGLLVGQHGTWIVTGYAIAGWVGVGAYYSPNDALQWRLPISFSCLWPLMLIALSPWVPESPRWLLTRGRRDDAWRIIAKLHGAADDEGMNYAREEFYQMSQQVQVDEAAWAQGGNRQLFTRRSYLERMWMGFFVQYASQTTGAMVIYLYAVQLYQNLGETGSIPLILGATYVTVAAISNLVGALIMDKLGRIKLLIIGLSGCMISLSLVTAMVAEFAGTTNQAGNAMGVFFTFCFITFYGGGIDVVSYVYCSEIYPTHFRSQGMAWSIVGTFLSTLAYVEAAPTALANIEWRYYIIFVGLTLINIIVLWWWCPETKGLSLEEINGKFGDEVVVHFADASEKERAHLEATVGRGEELEDIGHG